MTKIINALFALLISGAINPVWAAPLQHYQPGPRLIDGTQLNKMVDVVNGLTGQGGTPVTGYFSANTGTGPTPATGTVLQVVGANAATARVEVDSFGGVPIISLRRADGTKAAPTAIVSADQLGSFNFHGASTTALYYGPAARLAATATENWSSTAGGSKITFSVTPNTTQTLTDAWVIDQDQTLISATATANIKGQPAAQGGSLALTGGTSSTSGNAGGAVTLTGGTPGLTGVGGGVTITSGAGGGTSGAAGAVAITAGSATSANGASVTITAGAGAGGTNAGGSVNLVPGAAVSTGIPGNVKVNGDANLECPSYYFTGTPAATNQVFFISNRAWIVTSISQVHSTAAGGTSTLDVTKDTGTTAPAGGTALGQAAFNLNATANTVQNATLNATIATIKLAAGDRLAVKFNNAIQSSVGVVVTACLSPI